MKHPTRISISCALLLALVGCERAPVNSDAGMAEGKALGIDLVVARASRVETESEVHGNPQGSSRAEVTLGDDLRIEPVTMVGGQAVAFQLYGRSFCRLERGYEVGIDGERKVTVNGEERTITEDPPEQEE